jgi:hypothetical protein
MYLNGSQHTDGTPEEPTFQGAPYVFRGQMGKILFYENLLLNLDLNVD